MVRYPLISEWCRSSRSEDLFFYTTAYHRSLTWEQIFSFYFCSVRLEEFSVFMEIFDPISEEANIHD
jgi:hypothetical protein